LENASPSSLLHASEDYTEEEVIKMIQNGEAPPVENAKGPAGRFTCLHGKAS
jgi:hypothetical protein